MRDYHKQKDLRIASEADFFSAILGMRQFFVAVALGFDHSMIDFQLWEIPTLLSPYGGLTRCSIGYCKSH